jgi:hypothetical protein
MRCLANFHVAALAGILLSPGQNDFFTEVTKLFTELVISFLEIWKFDVCRYGKQCKVLKV